MHENNLNKLDTMVHTGDKLNYKSKNKTARGGYVANHIEVVLEKVPDASF